MSEKATEIRKRGDPIPQPRKSPGNNNQLPNNDSLEGETLPGDLARDVVNEGVAQDPKNKPIS